VASEAFCWKTDVMRCSYRPKGRDAFSPYDLIFFDPPYRLVPFIQPGDSLYKSIERLTKDSVSSESATLVFRTPESAEFQLPERWHLEDTIKASRMAIFLFQKKSVLATDEKRT